MNGPYSGWINWQADGKPDYLLGTGATRSEKLLTYSVGVAACAAVQACSNMRRGISPSQSMTSPSVFNARRS